MDLKKKKLFNEHGDRDWGKRRMIGGNTTNLIELNNVKYDWATKMYRNMMNNFWIPEEIPLAQDAKDYKFLSPHERQGYDKIISFLIFLDSLQTSNLPNINEYITAPEVNLCLTVQTFQEAVHSQSYSYILDSVCSAEVRDDIYNQWREDKHLLRRNRFITDLYEKFIDDSSTVNLLRAIMANYILEGIYFYSGFSFFYSLGRQGKMLGTVSEIKYIQRDELTHLALFQNIFREIRKENPEIFTNELIEDLRQMMKTAVEHEIEWGQYITNDMMNGLSNEIIDQYIKYLSNERLKMLGLEILYPEVVEHPMKWVENFSNMNSMKTDFFEQKVTNYSKSSSLNWDDL
ncbi:ribonucleoside-diphosphate reductase beta chain [Paenibacillus sp. 1_12]|uniref:Ribonucleoside-diphosphate reductase subunit beta n=1 Tax=Paenibacillus baimaensis TaxID=2982185 RepID=A0ABT2UHQ9_9BACL|nr:MULTISPECIES: ribonucleotide-diphosphate reductase subunit beta [unclassified Paenibacillus]MCU6793541.1 ribonucleotide-diphosphate reductase subunit beta [Paenibacillus sp. WQ 127069]OMF13652.1 ribonucleotide-diphosphate reductase subunit beta [Paenibacillus sp. FSL H7-0331]SFL12579.1 ribonucleoside-diphosphate reductase beta chain [Paenibacillus sp. 1_12]